jgi:formamidopyrimidine-DNA glycosylase
MLRDPRMFGKVFLARTEGGLVDRLFERMGPEPLSEDFSRNWFLAAIQKRSRVRIKSLLLDQRFIAGIGNIYADEALFEAGVHPSKRVKYLKRSEKEQLFEAIPLVLKRGIEFGGTSLRDYVNSDGALGTNQDELNVYGREGEPCRRCGTVLARVVIGQRSTHFCPSCQHR